MNVQEYRESLHEDIALAASANMSNQADEFLLYVTDLLSSAEEYDDFIECYYEGVSRRNANMRIDGYAMEETDGSCCIFICDYHGPFEDDSVRSDDINGLFRKVSYFVNEAVKYDFYRELEESTEAFEFAWTLHFKIDEITKFRFFLLTDAYNRQRAKTIKDIEVAGKKAELNVWDINRLFDLVNSKTQKESVEIYLSDYGIEGIPCVKAVEYHDVIADIELPVKYDVKDDLLSPDSDVPENVITYSSYMAVVPGSILNDLYLEYGSRLLEGNVRSFLSARGKVNKSIQNTIKNYPEMFFAYNNGIAATATAIETKPTSEGLAITYIKDLQIVNGGQTTASIANTLLTLKKGESADISKLFVPMKLSVLDHSMAEKIIPKISEYSNSQNKVDASDFFSNHPFHIRMEEYSRKTPAPAVGGNQYQQYWYYERTRGQYNQGKMKFKPKSSQMKQYEARYPEKQVIKMVDLAKYMELYAGAPHIVSKGKQEIVKAFAENIKKQWAKNDADFNVFYYKRVVALAILFKTTDEIIKQTNWYKTKHSYKANVIAYTISVLFDYIHSEVEGYELDFMRIWDKQALYPELIDQINELCFEVYDFITRDDRGVENVTQWCKQARCWELAKQREWPIHIDFIDTLIPISKQKEESKAAKQSRKLENEIDTIKLLLSKGKDYWEKVLTWGSERNLLSDMEKSVLDVVIKIETTGKLPSAKQASIVVKARERLITEGMPLQFGQFRPIEKNDNVNMDKKLATIYPYTYRETFALLKSRKVADVFSLSKASDMIAAPDTIKEILQLSSWAMPEGEKQYRFLLDEESVFDFKPEDYSTLIRTENDKTFVQANLVTVAKLYELLIMSDEPYHIDDLKYDLGIKNDKFFNSLIKDISWIRLEKGTWVFYEIEECSNAISDEHVDKEISRVECKAVINLDLNLIYPHLYPRVYRALKELTQANGGAEEGNIYRYIKEDYRELSDIVPRASAMEKILDYASWAQLDDDNMCYTFVGYID